MEGPKTLWIGKSWQTDAENCGLIAEIIMATEEKLYEDDIEYIRADLARHEAVKRLVEAAKEAVAAMDKILDGDFSCFGDCVQWEKCSETGGGCLILARLEAALAAVEG